MADWEDSYLYIDQCIQKKTYGEKCTMDAYCKDKLNLLCWNGVCSCNETQYWTGVTCANKAYYLKSCSNSVCLDNLMLYCKQDTKICVCPSTRYNFIKRKSFFYLNATNLSNRFWDGTTCFPQQTINETCKTTDQCLTSKSLICKNNYCEIFFV